MVKTKVKPKKQEKIKTTKILEISSKASLPILITYCLQTLLSEDLVTPDSDFR
jgi:hypothetical protein